MSLDDAEADELLLQYPGLLMSEVEATIHLWGTVKLQDQWYKLKMKVPKFPTIGDFQLTIRQGHNEKNYTLKTLPPEVNGDWTVARLIEYLPKLFNEKNIISDTQVALQSQDNIYEQIVSVVSPDSYEMSTNADATIVRFSRFAQHENHYLELELPSLAVRQHSLPDGNVSFRDLLQKCATLPAMVQQFEKYLEDLQPFYENFIDIDELCYVVEPPAVTTKHNWRLFLYNDRVFFKLSIADPFAPFATMSLQIIGPTHEVEKLRPIYSEGIKNWDADLDILKNLLRIFNICYFPMPPGNEERSAKEEPCNICLCYRMDEGEIPVVSCDNPKCTLLFHAVCLLRWFHTQQGTTREFLQVSSGVCPFCKAKLSTSFKQLLTDVQYLQCTKGNF